MKNIELVEILKTMNPDMPVRIAFERKGKVFFQSLTEVETDDAAILLFGDEAEEASTRSLMPTEDGS